MTQVVTDLGKPELKDRQIIHMVDMLPGTIVFYADQKHSEPLKRIHLKLTGFGDGSNEGDIINLRLPTFFYESRPLSPLRVDGASPEGPEIAIFKLVAGSEHLVWSDRTDKDIDNPEGLASFDTFWGQIELGVFPWGPGRYTVRAFVGTEQIAAGEIEVCVN